MFQALPLIRLLDVSFRAVLRHAQNLVVVLRLAPLQVDLRLPQFLLDGPAVRLALSMPRGLLEVRHRRFVLLELQVYSSARAEGFEVRWVEGERRPDVCEGVIEFVKL